MHIEAGGRKRGKVLTRFCSYDPHLFISRLGIRLFPPAVPHSVLSASLQCLKEILVCIVVIIITWLLIAILSFICCHACPLAAKPSKHSSSQLHQTIASASGAHEMASTQMPASFPFPPASIILAPCH